MTTHHTLQVERSESLAKILDSGCSATFVLLLHLIMDLHAAVPRYYHECLIHLSQTQFERLSHVLNETFAMANPPAGSLSLWSMAAAALGLRAGHVFMLRWKGEGRGSDRNTLNTAEKKSLPGAMR